MGLTNSARQVCLALLMILFVSPGGHLCMAQDAPPIFTTNQIENSDVGPNVNKVGRDVKSTFDEIMTGDFSGVGDLLQKYLVPACISLMLIVFGYMAATAIGRLVSAGVSNKVDVTLGRFVGKFVSNAILILIFLGILGKFGIDVTSFAAILAASGFAIGMALQGALSNFAAGVMLLIFRPFKVGDLVNVSGNEGVVFEIDLFTTRLNTLDNRHLILPNSDVFGSTIENFTHNRIRRVEVPVGVDYGADLRQTRKILEAAVSVVPGAVADPPPQIALISLGDSAVNWELRVWTRPENFLDVREYVTGAAKEALDAANISIPFPQMDVHVVNLPNQQLKAA